MKNQKLSREFHELFIISVILKGLDSLIEIVAGIALLIISSPFFRNRIINFFTYLISKDTDDIILNYLYNLFINLSHSAELFAVTFLLSHGIIKLGIVIGLLKEKIWMCTVAIIVFSAFAIYQIYRITITHSILLVILTVLDIIVIALTYIERRRLIGNQLRKQNIDL